MFGALLNYINIKLLPQIEINPTPSTYLNQMPP